MNIWTFGWGTSHFLTPAKKGFLIFCVSKGGEFRKMFVSKIMELLKEGRVILVGILGWFYSRCLILWGVL